MVLSPWSYLYAQQTSALIDIKAELDSLFIGLDKTKIPTGYLWDVAIPTIERERYNGDSLTNNNYMSIPVFIDMLHSINSASVGADTVNVQATLNYIQEQSTSNSLKIGMVFKPYNYIVSNALTDNLINYSNEIVSDSYINGIWQNPYGEDVLFGYAIGYYGIIDKNVSFTITDVDSASTLQYDTVQFDPGDGGDYRNVSLGSTINVTYSTGGLVETRLKISVGGRSYESHYLLDVNINNVSQSGSTPHTYLPFEDKTIIYGRDTCTARITYDTSVAFNKKPLIVSEGFDPWRLFNDKDTHYYSGINDLYGIVNAPNNMSIVFNNYDVFYVDWYNYGADIRGNAEAFKKVIEWVNSHYASDTPTAVLGQSMGGLIARYALRDMEIKNVLHNTTLFLSHDVPYLGANIPLGLMYTYWDLLDASKGLGLNSVLDSFTISDLGNYQAIKQMLPLYVNNFYNINTTEFQSLQDTLSYMGFPHGDPGRRIENVAIINGGRTGEGTLSRYNNDDYFFNTGAFASLPGLLSVISMFLMNKFDATVMIPGPGYYDWSYYARPFLHNNETVHFSKMTYIKNFLWTGLTIERDIFNHNHKSPLTGIPFDGVSGSFYNIDTVLLDKDTITFIPTASAMAMSNGFYRDFLANKPEPIVDTPFDSYVLPDTSTYHTSFYSGIADFLSEVTETEILGRAIAFPGDAFSIGPASYASSFVWSIDGPSGLSIDETDGNISGTATGLATVIAKDEGARSVISKRKEILAGFPEMVLSYNVYGGQYNVNAEYVDEEVEEFIDKYGLADSLTFRWVLEKDGIAVDSVSNHSLSFSFSFAEADTSQTATVRFRITYNGHSSVTSSLNMNREAPFLYNVEAVYVSANGSVSYFTSILNFPIYSGTPMLVLRDNPASSYSGPSPMSAEISGLGTFLVIPFIYIPSPPMRGGMIGDPCYGFDIFSDSDVQDYIQSVTESNSPLLLDVDIYGSHGHNLIQTITIPIYRW